MSVDAPADGAGIDEFQEHAFDTRICQARHKVRPAIGAQHNFRNLPESAYLRAQLALKALTCVCVAHGVPTRQVRSE